MKYYCNPINVSYAYSFKKEPRDNFRLTVNREAADPSMVMYKDKYYLFASMTGGVWISDNMADWEVHKLPENMPIYDYAPDVRVIGEWLYFTASNRGKACSFFRTKDPLSGPYEEIKGVMDYWDPNLFLDDDGSVYFYWGCDNRTPLWGIELDANTMKPIGQKAELIFGNPWNNGYERFGENHCEEPRTEAEIDEAFAEFLELCKDKVKDIPPENMDMIRTTFANMPYIEGAWMTKHNGLYYLQYACPGAELNVYADGVYIGESPLGPFRLANNNPYSYKPGGFISGAGHGSTMEDQEGHYWHTATMRISMNHVFERRVGIWPAGFDEDDELYCNQRYGDWPICLEDIQNDTWTAPNWFLLSYLADVSSSGCENNHECEFVVDENVQTWWKANSNDMPWIQIDLREAKRVHAIQINFADDTSNEISCPGELFQTPDALRYIDQEKHYTRWILEGSLDGVSWSPIEDKSKAVTDLPHDLVVVQDGVSVRYLRLTIFEVPYGVNPSVSGFRVFGIGTGTTPQEVNFVVERISDLDMVVSVETKKDIIGHNILWGNAPDKLYHSDMVMGECTNHRVGGLVKEKNYYVRVDAFNENGIICSETVFLRT